MGGNSSLAQNTVHDFSVKDIRGNDVDLSIYKGKVLLIVNVASECGLTTTNYKELNELYPKYKDQERHQEAVRSCLMLERSKYGLYVHMIARKNKQQ